MSSIYNSDRKIEQFFLGSQEITEMFLGNELVFSKITNNLFYKLHEFVGSLTVQNTIEAPVKRAILKGQTLENLIGDKHEFDGSGKKTLYGWEFMLPYNLTSGKTYLAIFDVAGTIDKSNSKVYLMDNGFDSTSGNTISTIPTFSLGHNVVKCIATNNNHRVLRIRTTYNEAKFTVSNVMFIEYQKGMENWDIPYFEGRRSVKLPVLTTSNEDGTKTNMLTVNEDVTLRGIGVGSNRVEDELDCLTGKVTERIREVTLNGSEEWTINNPNNSGFFSCLSDTYVGVPNGKIICDKLASVTTTKTEGVMVGVTTGKIIVSFDRNKTGVISLESFKEKLAQLQLKVCYEVENTIKTVDLTIVDQDGKTINKLNSFNGTTRVSTEVAENSTYPMVSLEVASE